MQHGDTDSVFVMRRNGDIARLPNEIEAPELADKPRTVLPLPFWFTTNPAERDADQMRAANRPLRVALHPSVQSNERGAPLPLVREVFVALGGQDGAREDRYFSTHKERDASDAPWMARRDDTVVPVAHALSQTRFLHPTEGRVEGRAPLKFRLVFSDTTHGGNDTVREVVVRIGVETQRRFLREKRQPLTKCLFVRGVPDIIRRSQLPTLYDITVSTTNVYSRGAWTRQVVGFAFKRSATQLPQLPQPVDENAPPVD